MKDLFNVSLLLFALILGCLTPSFGESYNAASVAILDANTGTYLYRKNSRTARAPASTIKVLTALTAWYQVVDKTQYTTISKHASSMQPTKAGLRPGEQYRLIDLIKACLVGSCNDAAAAVGEAVSGSESKFAQAMKTQAKRLGATRTVTTNASGLPSPSGMVSTCEDSLLFIRALRKVPELNKMMGVSSFKLLSRKGRSMTISNHNRLLKGFTYSVRGKTGYTRLARHCFLSWAEYKGRTVYVSILGAANRDRLWSDVRNSYINQFQKSQSYFPSYMKKNNISLATLHAALKRAGCAVAAGEKYYGLSTKEQVKRFQRIKKLTVDGIIGPQTWGILKKF
ncbi:MAG: peptidoglycan-binding protein [Planctomycetes bacterium]|nr:peptidoglycan-binding protein [Planctomycetota bacterium]